MPVLSTVGAASLRAFGAFRQGTAAGFISATGGTITTSGNYKYHTFTSSGTFSVTATPAGKTVDVLLVGGGGVSTDPSYGGGGAGGLIIREGDSISTGSYSIVIGLGATSAGNPNGGNTTGLGFTALGGGGSNTSGGSGGGAAFGTTNFGSGLQPTSASGGYGNSGGLPTSGGGGLGGVHGAGGGAGGAASQGTAGIGKVGTPLSGDTFARGGSTGYTGAANSGDGGGSYLDSAGSDGCVIIRYLYQ
jgi:hypothetical protein